MRKIQTHQHPNDHFNAMFELTAIDQRNPIGGANAHYTINGFRQKENPAYVCNTSGGGISLFFQNGPLDKEKGPNGLTIESLLAVCADRLAGFQTGKFPHACNEAAKTHILAAISALHTRSESVTHGAQEIDDVLNKHLKGSLQEQLDKHLNKLFEFSAKNELMIHLPVGPAFHFEKPEEEVLAVKPSIAVLHPDVPAPHGIRCVGVYNEQNARCFVDPKDLAPITVQTAPGHEQLTSAFKFNEHFNLLSVSESPALLEAGEIDQTDSLDPAVTLETVYVRFTGTIDGEEVSEVLGFVVGVGPNAQPGTTVDLNVDDGLGKVNMDVALDLALYNELTQSSGGQSRLFANAMANEAPSAYLNMRVMGTFNIYTAEVWVNAITVVNPVETGPDFVYEGSLQELLMRAEPLGYEIVNHRINYNRRPG